MSGNGLIPRFTASWARCDQPLGHLDKSHRSNRINLLHPIVKLQCQQLLSRAFREGIELLVAQTLRTFEEQATLYAFGRTVSGLKVTHAPPGYSYHNWGLAFDVAIKHFEHDPSPQDLYDGPWDRVGTIGESVGLEWGGHWRHPDRPHFQNTLGWTIARLLKEYPQGLGNGEQLP
jgi:peptidoglycan LD-endopeptidase CwlK